VVKSWALATGIVLLVIAGIGFVIPVDEGYSIPNVNDLCSSGMGQLAQMFGSDVQRECQQFKYLTYGIYGLGLTGIVLIIVGAVVSGSKIETLVCPYCNFVAKSENDLLEHKTKNHLDKSPYKCGECDFIGITEEILWNHYKDKHPDKKKW